MNSPRKKLMRDGVIGPSRTPTTIAIYQNHQKGS